MHQIIEGWHALTAKSVFIFATIVLALATANHFDFGTLVHFVDLVFTMSILAPWHLICHIVYLECMSETFSIVIRFAATNKQT